MVLDQYVKLNIYSASSLKQSACYSLGYIS